MTYNERVQAIAEEMAAEYFPRDKNSNPEAWEGAVMHKIRFARIAVARMAKSVREYYDFTFPGESHFYLMDYLITNGLIPDREDGADGTA